MSAHGADEKHCRTCTCDVIDGHGHDLLTPMVLELLARTVPLNQRENIIHEALARQGLRCWCES